MISRSDRPVAFSQVIRFDGLAKKRAPLRRRRTDQREVEEKVPRQRSELENTGQRGKGAAREYLTRALHIKEDEVGPERHEVAVTLRNLGTVGCFGQH